MNAKRYPQIVWLLFVALGTAALWIGVGTSYVPTRPVAKAVAQPSHRARAVQAGIARAAEPRVIAPDARQAQELLAATGDAGVLAVAAASAASAHGAAPSSHAFTGNPPLEDGWDAIPGTVLAMPESDEAQDEPDESEPSTANTPEDQVDGAEARGGVTGDGTGAAPADQRWPLPRAQP
jgi:hypothetical protein